MGALPKKKVTRARQAKRTIAYRLRAPSLSLCPQCNTARLPHHVCPNCGYYKGRAVKTVEASSTSGEQGQS